MNRAANRIETGLTRAKAAMRGVATSKPAMAVGAVLLSATATLAQSEPVTIGSVELPFDIASLVTALLAVVGVTMGAMIVAGLGIAAGFAAYRWGKRLITGGG